MTPSYIVLIADPDTDSWSESVNTKVREDAYDEYEQLKEDGTPAILICTDDFITV